MATKTFTGTTSGDMTVAGNYAGGVAPLAGDDIVFNTGSRTVTVGPGVTLVSITCTSGWSGSFGSPGSPVSFKDVTLFTWAGSGDGCYISIDSGSTITKFVAQRGTGSVAGLGTLTAAYIENADFSFTCTGLSAYYGMTPSSRITIGTSGTSIGTESFSYGTVSITDRTVTTARVVGKNARMYTYGTTAQTTTLHVQEGGTFNSQSSGTITTANISGRDSLITPVNSPYTSATITTLNQFSGGKYVQYANGTQFSIGTLNSYGSQSASFPSGPLEA
jgi:hypothetical protein